MKYTAENCPFCKIDLERDFIIEMDTVFAIFDKFPVSKGHALIIPKRHCANYFEMTDVEQVKCIELLNQVQKLVSAKFKPDGFNIGVNVNEAGGQTVPHVHIHLIPRYNGDVLNPEGGIRGVIPGKKEY
jgi:diadenosine tetraphosphate (Ap4A) HIT family hydrolase